jgi:hypothetical protein
MWFMLNFVQVQHTVQLDRAVVFDCACLFVYCYVYVSCCSAGVVVMAAALLQHCI